MKNLSDFLKKKEKSEQEQNEEMQEKYKTTSAPKAPNMGSYTKGMPSFGGMKMPKI
jgi:hypothetical protein